VIRTSTDNAKSPAEMPSNYDGENQSGHDQTTVDRLHRARAACGFHIRISVLLAFSTRPSDGAVRGIDLGQPRICGFQPCRRPLRAGGSSSVSRFCHNFPDLGGPDL